MFTIKACHAAGAVWIGGVIEVHTVTTEPGEIHPYDWMSTAEGKGVLDSIGEAGVRLSGPIDDGTPWTLLRVFRQDNAYNLVVPTRYTFILNEAGATIDRI